ncbi:hypothetical protein FKG94_28250 [Exilibacterium tricleocarpae]|uniref:Uncharacterized protein n=1 Tax=Exilibacterium tricleocarpae TaxID=2591008 RepID=A0A545SL33_9GAMM|nr:hypothetical protein [Exilibacterium tricleocarpae]TQV65694.1 hypothetical protein FKG94_28250 [Exilibacterium tricleocarpae]
MKVILKIILVFFVATSSLSTFAVQLEAKVLRTGIYGDGRLFVVLDTAIPEPGCEHPRFDVPGNHPQIDRWLSIALAAEASQTTVKLSTKGCFGGYATMDESTDSYLYIKKG